MIAYQPPRAATKVSISPSSTLTHCGAAAAAAAAALRERRAVMRRRRRAGERSAHGSEANVLLERTLPL